MKLTKFDKLLLEIIQKDFPITKRPFLYIAEKLNSTEHKVIEKIKLLKENKIIRQISPIFDTKKIGYQSALVAFKVDDKNFARAVDIINAHNGVNHNYLRDNEFNIWFTIAVPPEKNIISEINKLFKNCGARAKLIMPAIKTFKISVFLDFHPSSKKNEITETNNRKQNKNILLTTRDKKIIQITQENISITERPFDEYAEKLNMKVEKVIAKLNEFKKKNIMRRFAAILNHNKAGFKNNVLVVWNIPEHDILKICEYFIKYTNISHCYQRPIFKNWQWNIYTMIHSKTLKTINDIITGTIDCFPHIKYMKLKTVRELKKIRMKYFSQDIL